MSIFSSVKDAIFDNGEPSQLGEVDIEAKLNAWPGSGNLNWRTSIVDLMKLVGLEASYAERKELAIEFGREGYSGTAEDNIWLHRQMMRNLAANGCRVPPSLRD